MMKLVDAHRVDILGVTSARGPARVAASPSTGATDEETGSSPSFPQDEVSLSDEALGRLQRLEESGATTEADEEGEESESGQLNELTPEEQDEVDQMRERDAEVRRHEEAHASVGGQYAGSPTYEYAQGPDGKRYAVAGQVQIDVTPVPGDPDATIRKMTQVRAAALAPAEPSDADRSVAADAQQKIAEAKREKRGQKSETSGEPAESDNPAMARVAAAYQSAANEAPTGTNVLEVA